MMLLYICDDKQTILDELQSMLAEHYGSGLAIRCFSDFDSMLSSEGPAPDILISDIALGSDNGCLRAAEFHSRFPDTRIIFLTGYPELSADIFASVDPSNFLLKPVEGARLFAAVDKAAGECKSCSDTYFIRTKKSITPIRFADMLSVESEGRKLMLHTSSGDYSFYEKLGAFIDASGGVIVQCHKSYALNVGRITSLTAGEAKMDDGSTVPVSRGQRNVVRDAMLAFAAGK